MENKTVRAKNGKRARGVSTKHRFTSWEQACVPWSTLVRACLTYPRDAEGKHLLIRCAKHVLLPSPARPCLLAQPLPNQPGLRHNGLPSALLPEHAKSAWNSAHQASWFLFTSVLKTLTFWLPSLGMQLLKCSLDACRPKSLNVSSRSVPAHPGGRTRALARRLSFQEAHNELSPDACRSECLFEPLSRTFKASNMYGFLCV